MLLDGCFDHYAKNSLSLTCKSFHKYEQKDRTKTCVDFSGHVLIDYALTHIDVTSQGKNCHVMGYDNKPFKKVGI